MSAHRRSGVPPVGAGAGSTRLPPRMARARGCCIRHAVCWSSIDAGGPAPGAEPPGPRLLPARPGRSLRATLVVEFTRRGPGTTGHVATRGPLRAVPTPVPGIAGLEPAVLHFRPTFLAPSGESAGPHGCRMILVKGPVWACRKVRPLGGPSVASGRVHDRGERLEAPVDHSPRSGRPPPTVPPPDHGRKRYHRWAYIPISVFTMTLSAFVHAIIG